MELIDVIAGALGAAVVLFLFQEEVIPELRAVYDTEADEEEVADLRTRIKNTQNDIASVQAALRGCEVSVDCLPQREEELRSLEATREADRSEFNRHERHVRVNQFIVRVTGYVFFVIAGGLVAGLLADKFNAQGMSSEVQSLIIGASWITILSGVFARSRRPLVDDLVKSVNRTYAKASENEHEADKLRSAAKDPDVKRRADRVDQTSKRTKAEADEDRRRARKLKPLSVSR